MKYLALINVRLNAMHSNTSGSAAVAFCRVRVMPFSPKAVGSVAVVDVLLAEGPGLRVPALRAAGPLRCAVDGLLRGPTGP